MRHGISFTLTPSDRDRLATVIQDRNTAQKHVWRARIVLLSADGLGTHAIMREAGVSKTAVWRWQERFAQEGIEGLLRDKTRPAGIPPLGPEVADRVVALTQGDPPGETTHWTAAAMSKAAAISISSVQRIWPGHGLRPHRVRQFKLSTDPAFAAKLRDIVGLYVDPPAHAVVLSVDDPSRALYRPDVANCAIPRGMPEPGWPPRLRRRSSDLREPEPSGLILSLIATALFIGPGWLKEHQVRIARMGRRRWPSIANPWPGSIPARLTSTSPCTTGPAAGA